MFSSLLFFGLLGGTSMVTSAHAPPEPLILTALHSAQKSAPTDLSSLLGVPLKRQLYGWKAVLLGDEVEVEAFFNPTPGQIQSLTYDCHHHVEEHSDPDQAEIDCHAADLSGPSTFSGTSGQFETSDYQAGLSEALSLFSRRVAPLDFLKQIEIWQLHDTLQIVFTYEQSGQNLESKMMCHWHTPGHFDCHRQIQAGAGRP